MIPGINQKQLKRAMKQMGLNQESIEATQVIIKTPDKDLVIDDPSVIKIKMMGEESLQISGSIKEIPLSSSPEISEEDINVVVEQANVSREQALDAITKHKGDLASAILELKES